MLVMFLPLLQSACCQCQEWIKSQVLPADETSYENFTFSPLPKELTDACTESQHPLVSGRACGVWAFAEEFHQIWTALGLFESPFRPVSKGAVAILQWFHSSYAGCCHRSMTSG